MDVSIIIVNYNTISFLTNAIDSIFEQTKDIEYEIIVVDNNSTDNSNNILTEKYGDKVIFIALSENIGFGRANNEAAKIAKGKNLFFLNPDTVLLNNAVKILSDYLDDNPKAGCCGGNLYDKDEKPTLSFYRFFIPSIFEEINELLFKIPEKVLFLNNAYFNYTNKPLNVAYITGADLMIKKELFVVLNGFNTDFFMYYEETELEYRLMKINYLIISVPFAKIIHYEGKSFINNAEKLKKLFISRSIILNKKYNNATIKIINYLFYLRIKSRLLFFTILNNKKKITLWSEFNKQFALFGF